MKSRSLLLLIPLAIFVGIGGLFYAGLQRSHKDGGLASTLLNKEAPELAPTQLGNELTPTNEDLNQSTIKLVNFWASWCAPCRAEHPNLTALNEQGFTILGINYKDEADNALAFLTELGNPYTKIGTDKAGRIAIDWGVYGIPETFIIDHEGVVRLRWAGPITSRVLEERIMPALQTMMEN